MKKRNIITLLFLLITISFQQLNAQELRAKVNVSHNRIQGVDAKVFETLEQSLATFLNNTKWTNDAFQNNEKIDCNFHLNIVKKAGDGNVFSAHLTIQASRPVFNTDYLSPIVYYQDKDVTFEYEQSQSLQFDENNLRGSNPMASNLTAIIAYYVYVILGFDYDSFSLNGGTNYFKKAQGIVDKAPEGQLIQGWKPTENNRNRYWLVEQTLNTRYTAFRSAWYAYHRKGLDNMLTNSEEALENITAGIAVLEKLYKENTNPIILQFYFNAKSPEWVNLLQQVPPVNRKDYANRLMAIDITNANKYRNIK